MGLVALGVTCESLLGIKAVQGIIVRGLILAAYSAHGGIKSVVTTNVTRPLQHSYRSALTILWELFRSFSPLLPVPWSAIKSPITPHSRSFSHFNRVCDIILPGILYKLYARALQHRLAAGLHQAYLPRF